MGESATPPAAALSVPVLPDPPLSFTAAGPAPLPLEVTFDGGQLTSDGGLPWLAEAEAVFSRLGAQWDLLRLTAVRERFGQGSSAEARSTRNLQILLDVNRSIGSVLDLEKLLELIVTKALEVCRAERGFILLFDEDGHPTFRAARRWPRHPTS